MRECESFDVRVLALDERPGICNGALKVGGQWSMTVTGPTDLTYTVAASTNLIEWLPLQRYIHPPFPFMWGYLDAALHPSRFYRVWLTP